MVFFIPPQKNELDLFTHSFSQNHGSVESGSNWKVTILLEIHPFWAMIMGGGYWVLKLSPRQLFGAFWPAGIWRSVQDSFKGFSLRDGKRPFLYQFWTEVASPPKKEDRSNRSFHMGWFSSLQSSQEVVEIDLRAFFLKEMPIEMEKSISPSSQWKASVFWLPKEFSIHFSDARRFCHPRIGSTPKETAPQSRCRYSSRSGRHVGHAGWMRLHGTAGGASGTLRRYGGVACRRYFQHLFSGPQINKVPERKASYLCLINEDVDHQQKQKIETPKKCVYIYMYIRVKMCVYIWTVYSDIHVYIYMYFF